jgi:hemolysin activation/secretion protein
LKLFTFSDYAKASLINPGTNKKTRELTSVGCGFTWNVPDWNWSVRLDIGWPVSKEEPNDGDSPHYWWCLTKGF